MLGVIMLAASVHFNPGLSLANSPRQLLPGEILEQTNPFDVIQSRLPHKCGLLGNASKRADGRLRCRTAAQTDCTTLEDLLHFCPRDCPFVSLHPQLTCVFECAIENDCSAVNPALAFANSTSLLCEPCRVVGCKRCETIDTCGECWKNFKLILGGRVCAYAWDTRLEDGVHSIAALLAAIAVVGSSALLILDRCHCCSCCTRFSPTPLNENIAEGSGELLKDDNSDSEVDPNFRALNQGKRHNLRCKIRDLDGSRHTLKTLDRIPLTADLKDHFLMGVGLPLFHQWYLFFFCYSVFMAGGCFLIYHWSDLSYMLQTALQKAAEAMGRSVLDDALAVCRLSSHVEELGAVLNSFAFRASIGFFVMWIVMFYSSLCFASRQRKTCEKFYHSHPCIAEFSLSIEGFPPDAIDEELILTRLRRHFGCESIQVSICYDFRSKKEEVHELLEKILVQADICNGIYDADLADRRQIRLTDQEQSEVRSWFNPKSPQLRNAGSVFVVFPHNHDLPTTCNFFGDKSHSENSSHSSSIPHLITPELLPVDKSSLKWTDQQGNIHDLSIRDVACEPPEIVWEHMGVASSSVALRLCLAILAIVAVSIALAAALYVPFASYIIHSALEAGSIPTGFMMTVLGVLIGLGNWALIMVHIHTTIRIGFKRRDREALVLFKAFFTMCAGNLFFNLVISIWPGCGWKSLWYIFEPLDTGLDIGLTSVQVLAFQAKASSALFHMLVPGGLFIGQLMWPLQGFVLPYVFHLLALRCQHRHGGWASSLTARKAELWLEPLGINLGHDYMGHVLQPTSATLALFFGTSVAWELHVVLALWALYMIACMRYLHLRCVKKCFYSTNRMDVEALYAWGIPLSSILAASCYWTARIRGWPMLNVVLSWAMSFSLWAFALTVYIQPLCLPKGDGHACSRPSRSYEDVRSLRFYDWHNCNPIMILASHCGIGSQKCIMPFVVGKEYLQDPLCRTESIDDMESRANEAACLIPQALELETIVQKPLDAIGLLGRKLTTASNRRGPQEVRLTPQHERDSCQFELPPPAIVDAEEKNAEIGATRVGVRAGEDQQSPMLHAALAEDKEDF